MVRQFSRAEERKIEDATIKFQRDDSFDVTAVLTAEEYEKFGDRFPEKFKRIALLGRGGFSVVWLGVHRSSKRKVAIKQILTKNPHETHLKEIWFGSYFFDRGGDPREEFENHIGINNICKLYSYEIKTVDSWLYYEVCEESLGSSLFDIKTETISGEKCYKVQCR
jgi:dual specificity tyrosine-phosphorylation-regulated kinase 2/3/4